MTNYFYERCKKRSGYKRCKIFRQDKNDKSILSFNRREDMREVPVGDELIHFYIDCPVCSNTILLGWRWKDGSVFYPSLYIVED